MKIRFYKIHKIDSFHDNMIIVLVCILLCLLYLHAEHYPNCKNIYPDEIMDLPCSLSPKLAKNEDSTSSENIYYKQCVSFFKTHVSSVYNLSVPIPPFSLEFLHVECPKKRLFILQRFNS